MSLFNLRSVLGDPTSNPFERPSMPLSALSLDLMNGPDAGEPVTPEAGIALPTAYRCINIISTVVASCVIEQIDRKSGESDTWMMFETLYSYSRFEFFELVVAHLAGWGNAYIRMVKDPATKRLIDLRPLYPGAVKVKRAKSGRKVFTVRRDDNSGDDDFTEDDILHIPFFGVDGLQGLSPVMVAAQTFSTTIAADRLAGRFYSKGQQLGGIIKVKAPLAEQSQADEIKQQWNASHSGIQGAGGVAVFDAETDFEPITIEPNALQFLESRQWQASEVAKLFGLPAFMISEQTTWGTGIEQQWQGFIAMTLRAYTDRIEQRLTREFLPRTKIAEFDLNRLMRGSTMERYQAYGQAIGWGWMTRAEVRAKERLKEIDGLDEPLQPQSMNGALSDGPMASDTPPSPGSAPTAPKKPSGEAKK